VLLSLGYLTKHELDVALAVQRRTERRLGEILLAMGVITSERLVWALGRQFGIEVWIPEMTPPHPRAIATFPSSLALQYGVFPVGVGRDDERGFVFYVATSDPADEAARSAIISALIDQGDVVWLVASPIEINRAIRAHYRATGVLDP
jgi:hypothetical protein